MNKEENKYAQKILKEDYQNIINLYNDGYSIRKIAKEYHVVHSTITKILKKTGNYQEDKTLLSIKIPECEHANIIKLYSENGLFQDEIAKIYKVSKPTIGKIIRYYNIDTSTHVRKSQFSNGDIDDMYKLYIEDNLSCSSIAEKYGVDESYIGKLFKMMNYEMKDSSESCRKYRLNQNYFDIINTPEKAYYIGFLWADGCNFTPHNSVVLGLQESDKHILESFQKELETNIPLSFLNRNEKCENWCNIYRLSIVNKHMSQVLDSYGMCRAKSLILKFPECVPPELYSHCLRGYFDGDGCIPHSSTDYTTNIVGTKELLERVREIITPLGIKTSIKEAHPGRNKNTYVLYTTSKSGSKKFLDYMYDDATLYLYRKYDLYKSKYCA